MAKINIREFKAHFSAFIDRVAAGETIVIAKRNEAVAELRPVGRRRTVPIFGNPVGGVEVSDGFFEPLPDDVIAPFEGVGPQ